MHYMHPPRLNEYHCTNDAIARTGSITFHLGYLGLIGPGHGWIQTMLVKSVVLLALASFCSAAVPEKAGAQGCPCQGARPPMAVVAPAPAPALAPPAPAPAPPVARVVFSADGAHINGQLAAGQRHVEMRPLVAAAWDRYKNGAEQMLDLSKSVNVLTPNEWKHFAFGIGGTRTTFKFTVTGLYGELQLTDLYCSGDTFILISDGNDEEPEGPSPKVASICDSSMSNPEEALTMERYSKMRIVYMPGEHTVTAIVDDSPHGSGQAAIRIVNHDQ